MKVKNILHLILLSLLIMPCYAQRSIKSEKPIHRDMTERELKNGQNVLIIQKGMNYFDKSSKRFKVRNDSIKQKVNAEFTDEVQNDFKVRLNKKANKSYGIIRDGKYVYFEPVNFNAINGAIKGNAYNYVNVKKATDLKLEIMPEGIKETITLKDITADKTIKYVVKSNLGMIDKKHKYVFGSAFKMPKPTATDNLGKPVPVLTLFKQDTFIMTIPNGIYTYPIYIDPTLTIDSTDADTSKYEDAQTTNLAVNNNYGGFNYLTFSYDDGRLNMIYFKVDLSSIPSSATIASAKTILIRELGTTTANDTIVSIRRVCIEGGSNGAAADGEVTYNSSQHNVQLWTANGARDTTNDVYGNDNMSITSVDHSAATWDVDILNYVKNVCGVDSTHVNNGFRYISGNQGTEQIRSRSKEIADHTLRPRFEITYTTAVPSTPTSWDFSQRDNHSMNIDSVGYGANDTNATTFELILIDMFQENDTLFVNPDTTNPFIASMVDTTNANWKTKVIKGLIPGYVYYYSSRAVVSPSYKSAWASIDSFTVSGTLRDGTVGGETVIYRGSLGKTPEIGKSGKPTEVRKQ